MKVSLVITALNEEKTIDELLGSIAIQTLKPDGVIIVDGGSTDQTVEKLLRRNFKDINLRVLIKLGANRSQGRNKGIEKAKNEIVAITDCGCILAENWLEEITRPFENPNVEVVAGYYFAKADTFFQKYVTLYFCVLPKEIYEKSKKRGYEFLPSSRSFAFRKRVWKESDGYPEEMNFCEDLVFNQKIKDCGYHFYFAPKAVVYWPQRKTIKSVFRQFFNYATGDGQVFFSRYQTHSRRISLIFFRYFLFSCFLVLTFKQSFPWFLPFFSFVLYLLWVIKKNFYYIYKLEAFLWLPILQIISDIAIMAGTIKGISKNLWEDC